MASLTKQFERIAPFLNKSVEAKERYRHVLGLKPESFFSENDGNLFHVLGSDKNQAQFIEFSRNLRSNYIEEDLIPKLKLLFLQETGSSDFKTKQDGGWTIILNGKSYELGKLEFMYNWHVQGEKLMDPPDFFVNLAKAFNEQISSGTFYFGYLKDKNQRKYADFVYVIVFAKYGDEVVFKKLTDLVWRPIYQSQVVETTVEPIKEGSGLYKKQGNVYYRQSKGITDLEWTSSNWIISMLVYGLLLITAMDMANPYLEINDRSLPDKVAIPFYAISLGIFVLFLLNRKSRVTLNSTHLILKKGYVPFFLGFRRRSFELKDILRLDQESEDMDIGSDVATGGGSYMYKVYLTVYPTKKVRLTHLLREENADFIQNKIKAHLKNIRERN